MNRKSTRPQKHAIFLALGTLLGMACGLQWVTGQGAAPYYQAPYDKSYLAAATGALDEKLIKQETLVKGQILLGAVPFTENADRFKRWYTGYQFRAFSHIDQLHKLPARRKEIVDDLRRAKSKEIHDSLLGIADQYMKVYVTASQNIHPAVRFNAMLVIGDLNAEEQGFQNRYERPLPSALDFMLQEYQNPKHSDAVKLAAMIGILRHCQMNWARTDPNTKIPSAIPVAQQQQIAQLMLSLVTTKDPPPGRTPEGHVWMQRRGIDILAALGMIGNVDPVNQAITSLIADHNADMSLRCTAAAALYSTNAKAQAKSKIDPAKESLQLAALLVEACHRQLDKIDASQKKKDQLSGMGGYGMAGGYPGMGDSGMSGMMPGMSSGAGMAGMSGLDMGYGEEGSGMGMGTGMAAGPKDPLTELFRRQIKYEIDCVKKGLEGVGRTVNPDPRKAFPELYKDVEDVWKATDPPTKVGNLNLTTLHKGLKDSLKTLETKTAALLPQPKDPEPVPAESDLPADVPPDAAIKSAPAVGSPAPGSPAPGAPAPGAGAVAPGAAPAVPPGAGGAGNPAVGKPAPSDPTGDIPPE